MDCPGFIFAILAWYSNAIAKAKRTTAVSQCATIKVTYAMVNPIHKTPWITSFIQDVILNALEIISIIKSPTTGYMVSKR